MYVYQNAIVKKREENGRWIEEDLRAVTLINVRQGYLKVFLIVSHELLSEPVTVDMDAVRTELQRYSNTTTVEEWLVARGDDSLPTVSGAPEVTSVVCRYADAIQAGWKTTAMHPGGNLTGEETNAEYIDILMSKPGIDIQSAYEQLLVTVNGFVHRTTPHPQGIVVRSGNQTVVHGRDNTLGLISFKDVGSLAFESFSEEQIFNPHENGKLRDEVWLKLSTPIEDKTPIVVIGGYMELPSEVFDVVGTDTIRVNFTRIPWLHRYMSSKDHLNYKLVHNELPNNPYNDGFVELESLFSDEAIRALFMMEQSFVVLVDTDNLFVERDKLEYTSLLGRYYSYQRPTGPIQTEFGRMPAYLAFHEEPKWVIAVGQNHYPFYRFDTQTLDWNSIVTDGRETTQRFQYSPCYHLTIGSDLVELP